MIADDLANLIMDKYPILGLKYPQQDNENGCEMEYIKVPQKEKMENPSKLKALLKRPNGTREV